MTMVAPEARRSESTLRRRLTESADRLEVGSSNRCTRGSTTMAEAQATSCF